MQKRITFLVPFVLLFVGVGCGQKAVEISAEKKMNAELEGQGRVDMDNGTVNYESNTGDTVRYGENVQIPSDFPKDVPVYPGAKAMAVTNAASEDSASLSMSTPDSAAKVLAWYEGELSGWTKTGSFSYAGQESRMYAKGEFAISLMTAAQGDLTVITVVRSKQ